MSILTDEFPQSLFISGQECPIKTDFKVWIKASEIITKPELKYKDMAKVFRLIFDDVPKNFFDAWNAILDFYSHEVKTKGNNNKKSFDFAHDADMIYSAFMQQYKIDLSDTRMHWWKFKALFGGLSEDTHIVKAIQYRTIDLSTIKDKEQKKFYKKMKSAYKLPDNRNEQQKEEYINTVLEGMF